MDLGLVKNDKPWKSGPPQYDADHLAVWGKNLGFMTDRRFLAAYKRGVNSGHRIAEAYGLTDLGIEWRVHVCCWAATHATKLDGDFVECGVNTGVLSLAVCDYIDLNATGKRFWLFDTYQGIPVQQMSDRERQLRGVENAMYPECFGLAQENFKPFQKATLVRGVIPESLNSVVIDRVCYLSLDMNIALPERAAIEFFWPKLARGAPVIFDDYAWQGYEDQKAAMDQFAVSVGVEILTLPGQGLLLKP
jgi:O-methyltransferase